MICSLTNRVLAHEDEYKNVTVELIVQGLEENLAITIQQFELSLYSLQWQACPEEQEQVIINQKQKNNKVEALVLNVLNWLIPAAKANHGAPKDVEGQMLIYKKLDLKIDRQIKLGDIQLNNKPYCFLQLTFSGLSNPIEDKTIKTQQVAAKLIFQMNNGEQLDKAIILAMF